MGEPAPQHRSNNLPHDQPGDDQDDDQPGDDQVDDHDPDQDDDQPGDDQDDDHDPDQDDCGDGVLIVSVFMTKSRTMDWMLQLNPPFVKCCLWCR